jgi:RNA polymerase sigma-70 factor (ECF subfamily)
MHTTRTTLLERLRDAGDGMAWEEFFHAYGPSLFAYAVRRGCSDATAQEMVQEVMLSVYQGRDLFRYDRERGRFRDWIGGILRNKIAERRRRPSERFRGRGGPDDDVQAVEAANVSPDQVWEDLFEQALLSALLDAVRREINPRTYQAFELLVLHELPGEEVASVTGLSRNAVYLARRRVCQRLEELVGPYRRQGDLAEQLRQAVQLRLDVGVQRALTERIEKTMNMRSR